MTLAASPDPRGAPRDFEAPARLTCAERLAHSAAGPALPAWSLPAWSLTSLSLSHSGVARGELPAPSGFTASRDIGDAEAGLLVDVLARTDILGARRIARNASLGELRGVRLSDGASATLASACQWCLSRPYAITCEELFVHADVGHLSLARIALAALPMRAQEVR